MTDRPVDLDDEIARRVTEALATHYENHPHHTEAEIRDWIREMVESQRPVDPVPPTPPRGKRLPDSRMILSVDPNRPETMNADRPFGQVWAASNVFQLGETTDLVRDQLPESQRAGYGLQMQPDGSVHSWPMADKTTVRYGPIVRGGQIRFRLASQFRGPRDNYLGAAGNVRYSKGREVDRGGWRINTRLRRGEGESDARTFDGTRSGQHANGADISVGPESPTLVYGFEVEGSSMMHGGVNLGGPISLHEPGYKLTGPINTHIYRGEIIFGSKTSKIAEPLNYETASMKDLEDRQLVKVPAPMPGERARFVVAARVDRTGRSNPFLEVWRVTERDMVLVKRVDTPFGYGLVGSNRENDRFYPTLQSYLSGEWAFPTSRQVAQGMLPWNFDPHNYVYGMEFGTIGVSQDCTVEEMGEHLLSFPI